MKLIVCVDENWGIGCEGELLYHIPADLKYFKEKTLGNVVVMGKSTFLSLPGQKPLPGRENIILTGDKKVQALGAKVVHSVEEVLDLEEKFFGKEIFVIGGESVYNQFLPYCEYAFVTKVYSTKLADKRMANLEEDGQWKKVEESIMQEHEGLKFVFQIYCNTKVIQRTNG